MKNWFKRLLAGAGIGVAAAVPGVSGATIAVILKIYKSLIESVSTLFKNFKKNFLFLLPIIIGVVIAMVPCLLLFNLALQGFVFGLITMFCGLIIGSFPGVIDEVKGEKPKRIDWIILAITAFIAIMLGVLSVLFGNSLDLTPIFDSHPWWLYLLLIPIGAIASIALVVPGISGSMILLIMGIYKPLINSMASWFKELLSGNFSHVGPFLLVVLSMAIGVIVGFYFISKLMNYLMEKYHLATMYGIIGFILGSLVTLYFNHDIFDYYILWSQGITIAIPIYAEIVSGVSLAVIMGILSYQLVRIQRKQKSIL